MDGETTPTNRPESPRPNTDGRRLAAGGWRRVTVTVTGFGEEPDTVVVSRDVAAGRVTLRLTGEHLELHTDTRTASTAPWHAGTRTGRHRPRSTSQRPRRWNSSTVVGPALGSGAGGGGDQQGAQLLGDLGLFGRFQPFQEVGQPGLPGVFLSLCKGCPFLRGCGFQFLTGPVEACLGEAFVPGPTAA
ncbi:hypothetical protein [Kitasatospora sp. NPDC059803]|uniref:hypothetical protein n=1 Tax=Kitasatospora sp. NPDC059803 TaxID=3346953 RepID=UPI003652368F